MRLSTRTLPLFLSLLLVSVSAHAQEVLTPGSRGSGMAGAVTAVSDDGYSVWYNPALLAYATDFKFGTQYTGLITDVSGEVTNYGSLGHIPYMQVQDADGNLMLRKTQLRVDSLFGREAEPRSQHILDMHFVLPVQRMIPRFPQKAAFGGFISIPGAGLSIVSVRGQTPDQPFYPVMGSRIERLRMVFGAAIEVIDDILSIGASVSILASLEGNVGSLAPMTTFDPSASADKQEIPNPGKATFGQEISTSLTPEFGLSLKPLKGIDIGAYYRFPQSMDLRFDVAVGVDMNMGYTLQAELPYYLKGSFFYVPASTGLGIGVSLIPNLLLSAQLDYVFWSELGDNINISNFNVDPRVINDQGGLAPLEEYGDFKVRCYPVPPIYSRNTLNPKAGLEWTLKGGFTKIRLGYAYVPSALEEDQKYQNLLLDNSYHTVSGGVGLALTDPLGYIPKPILIDVHALVNILEDRVNKVGLEDPEGGYHAKGWVESSGYMYGFGIDFTVQL